MIKTGQLASYLETIYDFQMSDPDVAWCPMLVGKPGIGKTQFVNELARKKNVKVFHLILSQANPSEVCGMVMPGPDNTTRIFDPQWASDLQDGDILFLDEVLKAPKATLNSCLTMIEERRLSSGTHLPKVAMFAAANPTKTMNQLEPEIKQRLVQVEIEWSKMAWTDWVKSDLGIHKPNFIVALDELAEYMQHYTVGTGVSDWSAAWNTLTPRSAYKMLRYANTHSLKETTVMVESMYSGEAKLKLLQTIQEMKIAKKKTPQEQIIEKLWNDDNITSAQMLQLNDVSDNEYKFANLIGEMFTPEEIASMFEGLTVEVES